MTWSLAQVTPFWVFSFLFVWFLQHLWHAEVPRGQGSNSNHSSNPSHSSDNSRSLTHGATRELLFLTGITSSPLYWNHNCSTLTTAVFKLDFRNGNDTHTHTHTHPKAQGMISLYKYKSNAFFLQNSIVS